MSFDQYKADPEGWRRELPPPRKPNYLPLIIGCFVIPLLAGIGGLIYGAMHFSRMMSGQTSMSAGMLPKPDVLVGTQLAWQEPLGRRMMMSPALLCGDFDGDGSEEALLPGLSNITSGNMFRSMNSAQQFSYSDVTVLPDGSTLSSGTNSPLYMYRTAVWDYGNDGRDELVDLMAGTQMGSEQVTVYDLQHQALVSLDGSAGNGRACVDVNGDGALELVLSSSDGTKVLVYDSSGQLLHEMQTRREDYSPLWGDTDGDGCAELLFTRSGANGEILVRRRPEEQEELLSGIWQDSGWPVLAHDVDGDGCEELFSSTGAYLNVGSGAYTRLNFPAQSNTMGGVSRIVPVDIDGDGKREYATGSGGYGMDSALHLFDDAGTCLYYEEFGAMLEQMDVITDGQGREHLVILLDNRLLLYP
ncbi:MAG: VCBS repeat-containing protein [bacterium]